MTIREQILAYLAGESDSLPENVGTEEERLLAKAAQRLAGGLVPVPEEADAGKVLTAADDGSFAWAAETAEEPAAPNE